MVGFQNGYDVINVCSRFNRNPFKVEKVIYVFVVGAPIPLWTIKEMVVIGKYWASIILFSGRDCAIWFLETCLNLGDHFKQVIAFLIEQMNFGRIFITQRPRFLALLTGASSKRLLFAKRATIFDCFCTTNLTRLIASSTSKTASGRSCSVVGEPALPKNSGKMTQADTVFIDPSQYPLARRDESIVDDYHGTKVSIIIFAVVFAKL